MTCVVKGVDTRKHLLNGYKNRFIRYGLYWAETLFSIAREVNTKRGRVVKHPLLIADLAGFNIKQHGCISCTFYRV